MFCMLDDKGVIHIPKPQPGWMGKLKPIQQSHMDHPDQQHSTPLISDEALHSHIIFLFIGPSFKFQNSLQDSHILPKGKVYYNVFCEDHYRRYKIVFCF